MDLNLLSTFVVVAETSNFSAAAKKLGLIRSSVSRSVATLERELGVQLFNPTTRQVSMTSDGRALYGKVAPHVTSLNDVVGALPEREELPSGTLCVTAPLDIGALLLPGVLAAFSLRYPAVQLDMRLSNRNVDLVGEGFDVALRVLRPRRGDSPLVARKLTDIEMNVFASPCCRAYRCRRERCTSRTRPRGTSRARCLPFATSWSSISRRIRSQPPPFRRRHAPPDHPRRAWTCSFRSTSSLIRSSGKPG